MSIDCQCRVINTDQFSRALDAHEESFAAGTDTLRRDAARVFRTAKGIAAAEAHNAPYCGGSQSCCGSCLITIEKRIQARGYHKNEPLDTAPDPVLLGDACPFPVLP